MCLSSFVFSSIFLLCSFGIQLQFILDFMNNSSAIVPVCVIYTIYYKYKYIRMVVIMEIVKWPPVKTEYYHKSGWNMTIFTWPHIFAPFSVVFFFVEGTRDKGARVWWAGIAERIPADERIDLEYIERGAICRSSNIIIIAYFYDNFLPFLYDVSTSLLYMVEPRTRMARTVVGCTSGQWKWMAQRWPYADKILMLLTYMTMDYVLMTGFWNAVSHYHPATI